MGHRTEEGHMTLSCKKMTKCGLCIHSLATRELPSKESSLPSLGDKLWWLSGCDRSSHTLLFINTAHTRRGDALAIVCTIAAELLFLHRLVVFPPHILVWVHKSCLTLCLAIESTGNWTTHEITPFGVKRCWCTWSREIAYSYSHDFNEFITIAI